IIPLASRRPETANAALHGLCIIIIGSNELLCLSHSTIASSVVSSKRINTTEQKRERADSKQRERPRLAPLNSRTKHHRRGTRKRGIMGKKNSKNSKRSDKTFKAIKNGTDKEMKAFLKWLEDQISDISPLPANVTSAMTQTAYFCRDSNLFSPVHSSKILDLHDAGQFQLARPWTPEKQQLNGVLTWIDKASGTRNQLMASSNHMFNAYYYSRSSVVSLAHCLFMTAEEYLNTHENSCYSFWGPYISVIIKFDGTTSKMLTISSSIQLKTLVMMFTNGPIGDCEVRSIEKKFSPDELHLRISDWLAQRGILRILSSNDAVVIEILNKKQLPNHIRGKQTSKQQMLQQSKGEQITIAKKKSSTDAPSKLKTRPSGSKKTNSRVNVDYRTNPNDGRLEHSNRLGLIFEEAADIFKERRQHLNDLAIKKSAPKQKSPCKVKKQVDESEVVYHNTSCESKAGKTFFPVLIGHEEYLYKSSKASKLSQVSPLSLDLHGCTRDEALFKLSSSLPDWLDAAMKEHPYTLPVNIVAGGGSQIIADAVQHWIRESRNVTNRF
ncbi:LOW QUALITY PROTEIN: hypothetical protein ACHAWO_006757, partial [Cyclotella atomus]